MGLTEGCTSSRREQADVMTAKAQGVNSSDAGGPNIPCPPTSRTRPSASVTASAAEPGRPPDSEPTSTGPPARSTSPGGSRRAENPFHEGNPSRNDPVAAFGYEPASAQPPVAGLKTIAFKLPPTRTRPPGMAVTLCMSEPLATRSPGTSEVAVQRFALGS